MKKIFCVLIVFFVSFIHFPEAIARNDFLEIPLIQIEKDLSTVRILIEKYKKLLDFLLAERGIAVSLTESKGRKWSREREENYNDYLARIFDNIQMLTAQEAAIKKIGIQIQNTIFWITMPQI